MKQAITLFTLLILGCSLGMSSCGKDESINRATLNKIYKLYENGEIIECTHNGNIVYWASANVYDGGGSIYDYDGNSVGICNFAWGPVESICDEVDNCKVIYRVKDNIWGLPAANMYYLGYR